APPAYLLGAPQPPAPGAEPPQRPRGPPRAPPPFGGGGGPRGVGGGASGANVEDSRPHHICATPNPSLTLTLHQEDGESCAVSARLPFTKIGPEKAGQQRTWARSGCQGARRRVMGARGRHCRREILGTRFHGTNGTYRT